MYDVIVIGCGPAGLSAAINVRQRGGSVLCVGLSPENNPLWKAEQIDNYLGLPGLSGKEMMETFRKHAESMGVEFCEERVLNTFQNGDTWMISAGSEVLEAYSLVFAGGITRGKKYAGEEEHLGRGVSYCATCDGMFYKGKTIAVFCGSKRYEHEAAYLAEIAKKVYLFPAYKDVDLKAENVEIVSGAIPNGMRLPSKRTLAEELGTDVTGLRIHSIRRLN